MYNAFMINTRGDPLGTVRNLILSIWQDADLHALLVPTNGEPDSPYRTSLLESSDQLNQINPFNPIMRTNAARMVPGLLQSYPDSRIGVLFRPCEMRALRAMGKRDGLKLDNLTTISFDCLGTYPTNEFKWRAERKGSSEALTQETLQFARQGGIMAYRYRGACQLCGEPHASEADVNIGVLGLPVRQFILLSTRDKTINDKLHLEKWSPKHADSNVLNQRVQVIARLAERRNSTRERVIHGIADVLPTDIESLIVHLADCGKCQACLDACPLCMIDFPQRDEYFRYQINDIKEWLGSCSGCGMCEQACPQHHPLTAIFSHIHKELTDDFKYSILNSPAGPLLIQ